VMLVLVVMFVLVRHGDDATPPGTPTCPCSEPAQKG